MERTCKKCGHRNPSARGLPDDTCPACGAVYRKVDQAMMLQKNQPQDRARKAKQDEIDEQTRAQERARKAKQNEEDERMRAQMAAQIQRDKAHKSYVCVQCGTIGRPRKVARGSFTMEVAIWVIGLVTVFFGIGVPILIAAFFYSIWRFVGRKYRVCRSCGSTEVVRGNSPRGKELIEHYLGSRQEGAG